ncbi:MAG: PD-(D/E)XK nuclease family protein [Actinobacteria bacterium]|nr:PD-(D/E)XK nuclease family protein [Actinomycetota bacterium]
MAKFFDKLKTYEVDHDTATVFDLVDWIDLSMQMGESPLASDSDWTENDAVNILTVHSSKGLEFPVVFIVSLVAQRFPTRERKDTIPIPQEFIKEILPTGDYHLEEERRLFYVAMTRAKDKLYLTASNYYGEGKRERKISPFVFEAIGKEKVESVISSTKNGQLSLIDLESFNFNPQDPVQKPQNAINYLSYSQIQTFEICPLHYKLKYILKLPTPPTSAQSFGTTIHAVLRDLHQIDLRGEKINLAKIFDLLEKNWVNIGYDSKSHQEKALESAKNIITTYFENEYKKRLSPIALELPFTFNLKGIKVGGRIDRIDKINENNIEIIDYKTGNNIRTEKELSNDFQLSIYALAAREIQDKIFNKKPENIKLSLYYLESGQKISTFRTNDQLEEAKIRILKAAETISASDFSCSENIFCKSCEYKMLCSTKN